MKLKDVLNRIKNYFFFIVIGVLLVIITFKNGTINKQKKLLAEKPKVELVYKDTTIYLKGDPIPVPVEVIVPDSVPYEVERFLTTADSAKIAAAYTKVYTAFNSKYTYEKTFKDDTTAYIHLKQTITQNKPVDQLLTFTDRTPIVYVTNTEKVIQKTFSISGGIEAGTQGVKLGLGLVDYSNRFYKISYNPLNSAVEGAVYIPIFNIKH